MNEAFQRAIKAEDLESIRKVPKTDLHNHGVAGADPASVEAILGRRFAPLDHKLTSMREMHAWASENLGDFDRNLGAYSRRRLHMRLGTAWCVMNWAMMYGR
jgi:hypothetical protein